MLNLFVKYCDDNFTTLALKELANFFPQLSVKTLGHNPLLTYSFILESWRLPKRFSFSVLRYLLTPTSLDFEKFLEKNSIFCIEKSCINKREENFLASTLKNKNSLNKNYLTINCLSLLREYAPNLKKLIITSSSYNCQLLKWQALFWGIAIEEKGETLDALPQELKRYATKQLSLQPVLPDFVGQYPLTL